MDDVDIRALVADEVRRQLCDLYDVVYAASKPDLLTLRTIYRLEVDQGVVSSTPLAMRMYVDPSTAWRRLGDLARGGWVEPIPPRTGGKVRKAAGWRLTEKARFAIGLRSVIERVA